MLALLQLGAFVKAHRLTAPCLQLLSSLYLHVKLFDLNQRPASLAKLATQSRIVKFPPLLALILSKCWTDPSSFDSHTEGIYLPKHVIFNNTCQVYHSWWPSITARDAGQQAAVLQESCSVSSSQFLPRGCGETGSVSMYLNRFKGR